MDGMEKRFNTIAASRYGPVTRIFVAVSNHPVEFLVWLRNVIQDRVLVRWIIQIEILLSIARLDKQRRNAQWGF